MSWKRIIGLLLVLAGLGVLALNLNLVRLHSEAKWWQTLAAKPAFARAIAKFNTGKAYNPIAIGPIAFGLFFLLWSLKQKAKKSIVTESAEKAQPVPAAPKPAGRKRWQSCNVLQVGPDSNRLWQFDSRGSRFALSREQVLPAGQPLPTSLVGRTWRSLWQTRLNVAWLPAERVFLRVVKLPRASFDETLAMVELQLEKYSPMPITQIVWTIHVMPNPTEDLQTVVVVIAPRALVEEFLGQLEGQRYLADRLELPVLDQLQGTQITGDGAWIYPDRTAAHSRALVAWWYGGALQQLDLISVAPGPDRVANLREQITQLVWIGELDGWLKTPPSWHLVADEITAADWQPLLEQSLGETVQIVAPLAGRDLAAATALRAASAESVGGLLPPEYSQRYQQQSVDRLWMRGLGTVLLLYMAGVLIYFVALQVLSLRAGSVEARVAELSQSFTNAMQLKARYQVLQERQELKYAALDCWNLAAELMPDDLTLESYSFTDGKKVTFSGTAPADQINKIIDFAEAFRKAKVQDKPLFKKAGDLNYSQSPGGKVVNWSFSCELNRTETR